MSDKVESGVYRLVCTATGDFYVGSTQNFAKRFARHLKALDMMTHYNQQLQTLYIMHGASAFKMRIVRRTADRSKAYEEEERILHKAFSDPLCMNIAQARAGDTRTRHPEREQINAMVSDSLKALYAAMPEDQRKALFAKPGAQNGMFGREHTPEARTAISKAAKLWWSGLTAADRKAWKAEHRMTAAGRAALSAHAKTRTGEANPFFGKTHTQDTITRIMAKKAKTLAYKRAQGILPANTRPIVVAGVRYDALFLASEATGISRSLILHRVNSPLTKYADYRYVD